MKLNNIYILAVIGIVAIVAVVLFTTNGFNAKRDLTGNAVAKLMNVQQSPAKQMMMNAGKSHKLSPAKMKAVLMTYRQRNTGGQRQDSQGNDWYGPCEEACDNEFDNCVQGDEAGAPSDQYLGNAENTCADANFDCFRNECGDYWI